MSEHITRQRAYRKVHLVGDNLTRLHVTEKLNVESISIVSKAGFFTSTLIQNTPDLVLIDIDAYDAREVSYFLFLASCFIPQVPVILFTNDGVESRKHDQYLNCPAVLDVVTFNELAVA